jgi:hypothetical protein
MLIGKLARHEEQRGQDNVKLPQIKEMGKRLI